MKLGSALLAAVLMSTACIANTPASQGVIRGHVQRFVCPGFATSQPCPPKPVSGLTLLFSAVVAGKVFNATTDSNGNYSAALSPGTYRIELSIEAVDYGGLAPSPFDREKLSLKTSNIELAPAKDCWKSAGSRAWAGLDPLRARRRAD